MYNKENCFSGWIMKFEANILQKVRDIEYKRGITYQRVEGRAYKTSKLLYVSALSFTLAIHFILAVWFLIAGSRAGDNSNLIILASVSGALLVLGLIFSNIKLYLPCFIINLTTSLLLIVSYARIFEVIRFMEYGAKFYWCHLLPLSIIIICNIIMLCIALNEKRRTKQMYNKVLNGLYEKYKKLSDEVSNEEWQDFLKNYESEIKKNKRKNNEDR